MSNFDSMINVFKEFKPVNIQIMHMFAKNLSSVVN